ncbi:MAG: hypothetical protein WCT16_00160 [Candidatus Buchananbacteria bacterium]
MEDGKKECRTFTLYEVYTLLEYLGQDAARALIAKAEGEPVKYGILTLGQNEAILNRVFATVPAKDRTDIIKAILKGQMRINLETTPILRAVIDTNNDPRLPFADATIEKHARQGKISIEKRFDGLYINGQKVVLYRSTRQINGQSIIGYELRRELDGQPVLSASVLDFLLANQEYIPEEWKEKDEKGNVIFIFFWGTIFRSSGGNLYVRYLYWGGSQWYELYYWLDSGFLGSDPAAVLASISA